MELFRSDNQNSNLIGKHVNMISKLYDSRVAEDPFKKIRRLKDGVEG